MSSFLRRRTIAYAATLACSAFALIGAASHIEILSVDTASDSIGPSYSGPFPTEYDALRFMDDSLRGRSGKLLARLISPTAKSSASAAFTRLFGDENLRRPGVYVVSETALARPLAFITLEAFDAKRNGRIGAYRIGDWPGEHEAVGRSYGNPAGFIEVTRDNANTRISEHFRLRDFLTHDQRDVWPKYLVLREELVDKLELVIAQLEADGHPVHHMNVMSGFRTPQYNASGGNTSGRAELSRHMYGDASDVFVDNDGNGKMDDLNGDGRIDYRDAQVIVRAVEEVEKVHPELLGGGGVYKATSEHGPFAHIDVRGNKARWGLMQ